MFPQVVLVVKKASNCGSLLIDAQSKVRHARDGFQDNGIVRRCCRISPPGKRSVIGYQYRWNRGRVYALKCALKPLNWRDYPVTFSDDEKATLRRAFPSGVCDYRRPGPQERPPLGTWLDYSLGTVPIRG